jgi:glycosyltransferase involved in cell wall biosynthesis
VGAPRISVAIPVRDGWRGVPATVRSILGARARRDPLEIVLVDDASDPPPDAAALRELAAGSGDPSVSLVVVQSPRRLGVPGARNLACARATGEILVITDAHVRFSDGWDDVVAEQVEPDTILAGAIWDPTSKFVGYGCTLVVPFMGTHWVRSRPEPGTPLHVASSAATVLRRETFAALGGYDEGMLVYGAAEPEFSLRAWLSDVPVLACPDLRIAHRFKTAPERRRFIGDTRTYLLHNGMRFGLLYLDDELALRMLRHLCSQFPAHAPRALELLAAGDTWERRTELRATLAHDFAWFVERFALADQTGVPLVVS